MVRSFGRAAIWLAVVLALVGVGRRACAEVPVLTVSPEAELARPFYEVDARSGRARFVLYLVDPGLDIGYIRDGYRPAPVDVPGLTYDSRARTVVYAEPGQAPVVCARVVSKRFLFFHYTTIDETGRCGVTRVRDEAGPPYRGFPSGHARRRVIYFGRTR